MKLKTLEDFITVTFLFRKLWFSLLEKYVDFVVDLLKYFTEAMKKLP